MSPPEGPTRADFLASVIVTGVESGYHGIGYWAECRKYRWEWSDEGKRLLGNASVEIRSTGGETGAEWRPVTLDTVRKGLAHIRNGETNVNKRLSGLIMVAERDSDAGDIDSEAADCIIQAGLFGQIVYG